MLRTMIVVLVAGGVAQASLAQRAPVGFYRTGVPGGHRDTSVGGLSADGTRVIGYSARTGVGGRRDSFIWEPGAALTIASEPAPDFFLSTYTGLSAVGNRAVGYRFDGSRSGYSAVTWSATSDAPASLGFYSGRRDTYAWAVSGDGSTVVGHAETVSGTSAVGAPVRWTEETGFQSLGQVFSGSNNGRALAANFDGTLVVGTGYNDTAGFGRGFRWSQDGGYTVFPNLARIDAITPDGQWMGSMTQQSEPVRVSASGALLLLDPSPSRFEGAAPLAMSDDGRVIVGTARQSSGEQTLFVWTESDGMNSLAEYLASRGAMIPSDFTLETQSLRCSADGLVFSGNALNSQLLVEGWVAIVPAPSTLIGSLCLAALTLRRRR